MYMQEIQIFIIKCINLIATEGAKKIQNKNSLTELTLEVQKYLRMLRELERMKYLLAPEEVNNNFIDDESYLINRIDPAVAELADILGYDGDLEGLSTDDIKERTGH